MRSNKYPGTHRPTPRCVGRQFVPPGPRRLENLAAVFLDALTPDELLRLRNSIGQHQTWPVGTLCSGTESPLLAWHGLAAAFHSRTGQRIDVEHAFSCELDEQKRLWILALFPEALVFTNALDLNKGEARTHQGDLKPVPDHWRCAIAGFPCTAVSGQNPHARAEENLNCIASGSLATGSVFAVIVNLAEVHLEQMERSIRAGRFVFILLENVVNLAVKGKHAAVSNLDEAKAQLEATGWVVIVWHLSPKDFGVPASRPRLWIAVVPRIALEYCGHNDEGEFRKDMFNLMDRFVGFEQAPLDRYLLPDDSPLIVDYLKGLAVKKDLKEGHVEDAVLSSGGIILPSVSKFGQRGKRSESSRQSVSDPKWHKKHEKAYEQAGKPWSLALRFSEYQLDCFPGLNALVDRQVEVLDMVGVVAFPEAFGRSVELKHNVERCRPAAEASCILPGGMQYLTHKCRMMHPFEALMLQGIDVSPHMVRQFKGSLVQSLAGNAFETSCCLATMLCTMVSLSPPPRTVSPHVMPPAGEGEGGHSDSDSESFFVARVRRRRLC